MSVFAIADLHLSLGENKPMDVFSGWENYVQRIEKNWRSVVKETDTVVIAGDISWAMKLEEAETDFGFINSLPGRKLIIKGNHDYWWSTKKKIETFLSSHGFESISIIHNSAAAAESIAVCGTRGWLYTSEAPDDLRILNREVGRLNASIDGAEKLGLEPVVFLHYPPVYDGLECKEILEVLVKRNIKRCYFGHIHGLAAAKRAPSGLYHGIEMHLVSCDTVGFMPVLVRQAGI